MMLDSEKSRKLPLYKNHKLSERIAGIPVVSEYKYIGQWMQSNMSQVIHLRKTNPKIAFITNRLTPLKVKGDLRFNLNLYRVFIMPQYKLMASLFYASSKKAEKQAVILNIKNTFNKFINVTKSRPNAIVEKMIGDT